MEFLSAGGKITKENKCLCLDKKDGAKTFDF